MKTLAQAENMLSPADARTQSTRLQLMLAAERLLSRQPIDQVSLMAIGREAGQANKSVVQYHFGTLDSLVNALLEERVHWLERRRAELLDDAEKGRVKLTARDLLEITWRPIMEIVDVNREHTFARFLLQWTIHGKTWVGVEHPLYRTSKSGSPIARIAAHLSRLAPHVPQDCLSKRMFWSAQAFLSSLIEFENTKASWRGSGANYDAFLNQILDFCEAGLVAAPSAPIRGVARKTARHGGSQRHSSVGKRPN